MRTAWFKGIAALSCAFVLATTGTSSAQAQAQTQIKWRMQTILPASSVYLPLLKKFSERVEKASAGRLKIEVLPDGSIVSSPEILDAVDKGIVEAGFAGTHWWSGKHPAAGLFSNPMAGAGVGLDQVSHVAWMFEGGGYDLYRKFYSDILKVNVEPMVIVPMGPDPMGWFRVPINSVEEFRKLKFRAPPGLAGEIFREMGIAAVAMPGGEIVPGAQRGVIDAAEWIGPAEDLSLGLHTIWKNYYLQGLHQSTDLHEIIINKTAWQKLPADLQEIVRTAAMATMIDTQNLNVYRNAEAIKLLQDKHNVTIRDTPKDFYPEFVAATNTIFERYSAKDPFFKEVLESQRKFGYLVVPYWVKVLDLYSQMGHAAIKRMPR